MIARVLLFLVMTLAVSTRTTHAQGFGVCKPVAERTTEVGCWILVDQNVGLAQASNVYWHLDSYADSARALQARPAHGVVINALGKPWVMTIDAHAKTTSHAGTHVADIGPLKVKKGVVYSAVFMEAITTPGMTSAVHRHSGPEAWYTVSGETCLETPRGTIKSQAGKPAIVPEGSLMFLTATGTQQRRAITLILHDASKAPTTIESNWKPKGLCGGNGR